MYKRLIGIFAVFITLSATFADRVAADPVISPGIDGVDCLGSFINNQDSGTVYYASIWRPHVGTITLNSNVYQNNNIGQSIVYNVPSTDVADPDTLYSVYGLGLYSTSSDAQGAADLVQTGNTPTGGWSTSITRIPSATGYTFGGFYTVNNSQLATQMINNQGTIVYANSPQTQIVDDGGTTTWYAMWTPVGYTISYKPGTAGSHTADYVTGTTNSTNVTYGETNVALAANGYAAVGYHFIGWQSAVDLATNTATTNPYTIYGSASAGQNADWTPGSITQYNVPGNSELTATWAPNKYHIIYHDCDSTNTTSVEVTFDAGYSVVSKLEEAEFAIPTGQDFMGWTKTLASQELYAPTQTWTLTTDLDLYAVCLPSKYNITYNPGSCAGTAYTYDDALTHGQEYNVLGLDATGMTVTEPTGKTFKGWSDTNGGSVVYEVNGEIPENEVTGNINLYAVCDTNTYVVVYQCKEPKDESDTPPVDENSPYEHGSSVTVLENTCEEPNGQEFDYWLCNDKPVYVSRTGNSGDSATVSRDSGNNSSGNLITSSITSNITCTAQWKDKSYYIYYLGTDKPETLRVTGSMNPQKVVYNKVVTLTANGFALHGYDFDKWLCYALDARGEEIKETPYEYQDRYTINAYKYTSDLHCYAQWTSGGHIITLDGNGATNQGTPKLYTMFGVGVYLDAAHSNSMTATTNGIVLPTKDGYVFDGYYNNTSYDYQYIGTNGLITNNSAAGNDGLGRAKTYTTDQTWYAKWTAIDYKITYVCDETDSTQDKVFRGKHAGDTITLMDYAMCNRPDNKLDSWDCTKDGVDENADVPVRNGEFTMPANDVTCTPTVGKKTYDIVFDGNNATSGEMSDMTGLKHGIKYALTPNAFMKKGYDFAGWCYGTLLNSSTNSRNSSESQTCSGRVYQDEAIVSNLAPDGETATLYAMWNPVSYTISYTVKDKDTGNIITDGITYNGSHPTAYSILTPRPFGFSLPNKNEYTVVGTSWYDCSDENTEITQVGENDEGNLNLCITMRKKAYPITYYCCIEGDCSSPILLNEYIASNLLTYTKYVKSGDPYVTFPTTLNDFDFGYTFNGVWYWDTSLSSTRIAKTTRSVVNPPEELPVYTNLMRVEAPKYNLIYDCQLPESNKTFEGGDYESNTEVPLSDYAQCDAPEGYVFEDWDCGDDIDVSDPGDLFNMPAHNVKCDANWNVTKYTVTYDCNNGNEEDISVDPKSYAKGINVEAWDGSLVCQNGDKIFGVWECEQDADVQTAEEWSVTLNSKGRFEMPGHAVLCKAKWSDHIYNITYSVYINGRSMKSSDNIVMPSPVNPVTYTVNSSNEILREPTKDEYVFSGWYECSKCPSYHCAGDANDKISEVPGDYYKENPKNLDLCGEFKEKEYPIVYYGCVAGDCDNPIELNQYIAPELLTYKKYRKSGDSYVVFPVRPSDLIPGNYFNGVWYWDTSLSSTRIAKTTKSVANPPEVLPVYTNLVKQYTVTYDCGEDADANSVAPQDKTKYYSGDYALVKNNGRDNCKRTGWTFGNMWVCEEVEPKEQVPGNRFEIIDSNVVCKAKWTPDQYTITYKPGMAGTRNVDGEDVIKEIDYEATEYADGTELKTLASDIYSITGYTFSKWESDYNVEEGIETINPYTDYSANNALDIYKVNGNTIMKAAWTPNVHNVVYKCGSFKVGDNVLTGGYTESAEEDHEDSFAYDDYYGLRPGDDVCELDNFEFDGWNCTNGLDGSVIAPETAVWNIDADSECEAQWHGNIHTISYSGGFAGDTQVTAVAMNSQNVYYGDKDVLLRDNTYAIPGWTFNGWVCKTLDENENEFELIVSHDDEQNKDVYMMPLYAYDVDSECEAQWLRNKYDVIYECGEYADADSVAPKDTDSPYYPGTTVTVKENGLDNCSRKNHSFKEWMCKNMDDGSEIQPDLVSENDETAWYQFVMPMANVLCTADWGKMCCSGLSSLGERMYLNVDAGVCDTCPAHSSPESTECPEKCECDVGYKLSVDGTTCEPEEYTIEYEHNGGDFLESQRSRVLTKYTVETPNQNVYKSVKEGSVFLGWYEDPNFESQKIEVVPEPFRNNPHNVTLYAKWTDAGSITYVCPTLEGDVFTKEFGAIGQSVSTPDEEYCEECTVANWVCTYDVEPQISGSSEDVVCNTVEVSGETSGSNGTKWVCTYGVEAPMTIPSEELVCNAVLSCGDKPYDITYEVYAFDDDEDKEGDWVDEVKVGGVATAVEDLTPNTYVTSTPTAFPTITLDGYDFQGWYDNPGFEGEAITHTPVKPDNELGENITVYGKMVKSFVCKEDGAQYAHWLHINDEKVCVYEHKYTNPSIKVRKTDGSGYYYIMMKQADNTGGVPIHKGSNKKMHIRYNGRIYNVCDKSSCKPTITY